jgi:hypothetical protein
MATRVKTRVRINHNRTAKDGWVPETTMEFEWDGLGTGEEQDEEALHHIGELLRLIRVAAYKEAEARNGLEGRSSVWRSAMAAAAADGKRDVAERVVVSENAETQRIIAGVGTVDAETGEILG